MIWRGVFDRWSSPRITCVIPMSVSSTMDAKLYVGVPTLRTSTKSSSADEGILPEALVNYLALLGWSLDDRTTVFTSDELVSNFGLDRVSRNPAIFDAEKLEWLNGVYIRETHADVFIDRMTPLLAEAGLLPAEAVERHREWLRRLAPLVSERIKRLDEIVPMVRFLFADTVEIEDAARVKVLAEEGAGRSLDAAAEALASVEPFEPAEIEAALRDVPPALGLKAKVVFQAVRVAVTGATVSPPLFESLALLGREPALDRIRAARPLACD
jgi:glutamyl-tRNA synthetase